MPGPYDRSVVSNTSMFDQGISAFLNAVLICCGGKNRPRLASAWEVVVVVQKRTETAPQLQPPDQPPIRAPQPFKPQNLLIASEKMANEKPLSAELEPSYFQLQAYLGATKHMGGLKATNELITLCHITKNKHILDIGCGTGTTPTHIAKTHHSTVIALDINKQMIQWTKELAERQNLADKVQLIVGDAQNIPFKDNLFDAVITESVTIFLQDKHQGLNEYIRVTKPGGYIGLNEGTWTKTPPPTELLQYMSRIFSPKAEFLTSQEWEKLLETSGLEDITARTYKINLPKEFIYRLRQLDLKDFSRALSRFLALYITSSPFRRTIKERYTRGMPIRAFIEYLGYGIYVGRK